MEAPRKKIYDALIVDEDKIRIIERPTVLAETSTEARYLLEERYGKGRVMSVWNEEDSQKAR